MYTNFTFYFGEMAAICPEMYHNKGDPYMRLGEMYYAVYEDLNVKQTKMTKYRLKKELPGYEVGSIEDLEVWAKVYPRIATVGQLNHFLGEWLEPVPEEKKGRWKPSLGQWYCYVKTGFVHMDCWIESDCDKQHYEMGNVYKDATDAKRARDRQLALVELQDLAEGWEFDDSQDNYFIRYTPDRDKFDTYSSGYIWQLNVTYFESGEKAQHAISVLGEEKLKLIFNVK